MRPGLIRPGNTDAGRDDGQRPLASMRPGLIRRKFGNLFAQQVPARHASMRPGLIRPGNLRSRASDSRNRAATTLQ